MGADAVRQSEMLLPPPFSPVFRFRQRVLLFLAVCIIMDSNRIELIKLNIHILKALNGNFPP